MRQLYCEGGYGTCEFNYLTNFLEFRVTLAFTAGHQAESGETGYYRL